jgi:hypothetical protein
MACSASRKTPPGLREGRASPDAVPLVGTPPRVTQSPHQHEPQDPMMIQIHTAIPYRSQEMLLQLSRSDRSPPKLVQVARPVGASPFEPRGFLRGLEWSASQDEAGS